MEALASLAFADCDYLTAARYCRNLAETVPDRFENWFNLGVAYHKMGNHLKAAQAYQQATVLKPDSAQAHLNLGVAHQELSDLPAARACYERALEIDGRQPDVLWNLALASAGTAGRADLCREALRPDSRDRAGVVRCDLPVGLPAPAARGVRPQRGGLPSLPGQTSGLARSAPERRDRLRAVRQPLGSPAVFP